MADIDDYLASSIDDYLLSIAEGIQLAQSRLDRLQTSSQGSSWSYYLPKLDFELKVAIEMVESKEISAKLGEERLRPDDDRHLMMRPIGQGGGGTSQIAVEAASVIRGSFMAVPADGGKPAMMLRSRIARLGPREAEFSVEISDTAGGVRPGLEVHFNIDRDASRSASAALGHDVEVAAGTWLSEGVVTSDASGCAATRLVVDPDEPSGRVLVISLDVAGRSELVHYEVGS